MMHRMMALGLSAAFSTGALGQWCVPGGSVGGHVGGGSIGSGFRAPATTFRSFQSGHNFAGTPSRAPRRAFNFDRNSLLLEGAVDITPARGVAFRGGHGFVGGGAISQGVATVGSGRAFFEGSTLNIRGEVSTGDVELALTLGTGAGQLTGTHDRPIHKPGVPLPPEFCKPIHPVRPVFPVNGFVVPWWWGYSRAPYPVDGPVIIYRDRAVEEAPVEEEAEEAEPLTEPQRAALLLRSGDAQGAISVLRSHVKAQEEDAEAMRLLAVALLMEYGATESS